MDFKVFKNFTVIAVLGLASSIAWAERDISDAVRAPEFVCPLDKPATLAELEGNIRNLYSNLEGLIATQKSCKGNSSIDLGGLSKDSNEFLTSAKAIGELYNSANSNQFGPDEVAAFQEKLTSMADKVGTIGKAIADSNVFQACPASVVSPTNVIQSIGKITASLAPAAMTAATGGVVNPVVAQGLMSVATGGAGLASIAKLFNQWKENPAFNMDDQEKRDFVLQQTCGYYSVYQRYRIVKAAASRNKSNVLAEAIRKSKIELEGRLNTLLSPETRALVDLQRQNKSEVPKLKARLSEIPEQVKTIMESLPRGYKELCDARSRFTAIGNEAVDKIQQIYISPQLQISDVRLDELLNTGKAQINQLSALAATPANPGDCGRQVIALAKIATAIADQTETIVAKRNQAVEKKLKKSKSFASYAEQKAKGEKDIEKLVVLSKTVASIQVSSDVLSFSDMGVNLEQIRIALLQSTTTWDEKIDDAARAIQKKMGISLPTTYNPFNNTRSLLQIWVDYVDEKHLGYLKAFKEKVAAIKKYSLKSTSTGGIYPTAGADGGIISSYQIKQIEQAEKDRATSNILGNFKLASDQTKNQCDVNGLTIDCPAHKRICGSLSGALDAWGDSEVNLQAQKYFCKSIEPLLFSAINTHIYRHCIGQPELDPKNSKPSIIKDREDAMGIKILRVFKDPKTGKMMQTQVMSKNYSDMLLIQKKYDELKCTDPIL